MADNKDGLKIIEVTDPYNPTLEGSIGTNGISLGVSTMYKGEKIYALRTDYSAGL